MKKVLTRTDLVLFGLVILTPTAPYPVYGIIQQVSQGHAALSYLIAMFAMLFTAMSYARMALAYPSAGSTYTYVLRTIGAPIGFLAGWAMLLDYFLIPLESVIYAAITAARIVPAIPYSVWAALFVAFVTWINIRGIRLMARANTILMLTMAACAIVFVVLAAHFVAHQFGWGQLVSGVNSSALPDRLTGPLMQGAAIATLSYIGFDAISTLAEDAVDARRDIGFATVAVCIFQALICIVTVWLAAKVWPDYRSFPQVETAILDIGRMVGGPFLFAFITATLLVAGLASALTGQAGASRLLFAMGRDHVLPSKLFGYLHPRYSTPTRAIWVITVSTLTGALFLHFQAAVELLNFGAFMGFILVNLGVCVQYLRQASQHRLKGVFAGLVAPLCGVACCLYVWASLSFKARFLGFVWLGLGFGYLLFLTRGLRRSIVEMRFEEAS